MPRPSNITRRTIKDGAKRVAKNVARRVKLTAKMARHPMRAGRVISVMEQRRVIEDVKAWLESGPDGKKHSLKETRNKMRAAIEQVYSREINRLPGDKKKAYRDKLLRSLIQRIADNPNTMANPMLHSRRMHNS